MTRKTFYRKLELLRDGYRWTYTNGIRAYNKLGVPFCPITCLYNSEYHKTLSTFEWDKAAEKLGLPFSFAEAVVEASDASEYIARDLPHNERRIRQAILRHLGVS